MACPFNNQSNLNCEDDNAVSYSEYLQLDSLLSGVNTRTEVHDEHLFIIVHQVYELWFKQIIFELDSVRNLFLKDFVDERHMLTVNRRLGRVVKILAILVDQVKILETMTPLDFADFRTALTSSSGFQSWQFRVLENKIGVKKENRINYNNSSYIEVFKDEQLKKLVLRSEEEQSIFDVVEAWLERTPGLVNEHFNFWKEFTTNCNRWFDDQKQKAEKEINLGKKEAMLLETRKIQEDFDSILIRENYDNLRKNGQRHLSWKALQGALMIYYYRDEVLFHGPFQMLTLLMDIDSLISKWRSNHVLLVQRQLGTKTGTGGSSGYRYLRATVSDRYKAFLDLFYLSNYLIPREYIPKLHERNE
ncbi:tryptophan 2,3-dioxygenase-like [Hydractinia symbiolongicarpus]|uniref:tryptophan 2,3-dioxygenase-like n=1 Tax=Hydractinia symbiolongicarpus TaxID=13093 RepID=UPI00255169F3|nr:tryptophan 2,3-dioxygenase-like [Hydractinia symbiolongicarpus]